MNKKIVSFSLMALMLCSCSGSNSKVIKGTYEAKDGLDEVSYVLSPYGEQIHFYRENEANPFIYIDSYQKLEEQILVSDEKINHKNWFEAFKIPDGFKERYNESFFEIKSLIFYESLENTYSRNLDEVLYSSDKGELTMVIACYSDKIIEDKTQKYPLMNKYRTMIEIDKINVNNILEDHYMKEYTK